MTIADADIQACLLRLVRDRGPDKTICPSEVARSLGAHDWRSLMPQVRAVGVSLAASGTIEVTQKGQVINPQTAKGPIRYRLTRRSSTQ